MGRGPSVVARPEKRGTVGVGSLELVWSSVRSRPHSSQSGDPPTAGAGAVPALEYWGVHFLIVRLPTMASGGSVPTPNKISGSLSLGGGGGWSREKRETWHRRIVTGKGWDWEEE